MEGTCSSTSKSCCVLLVDKMLSFSKKMWWSLFLYITKLCSNQKEAKKSVRHCWKVKNKKNKNSNINYYLFLFMWGWGRGIFEQPLLRSFSILPPNLYICIYHNYVTIYLKTNFILLYFTNMIVSLNIFFMHRNYFIPINIGYIKVWSRAKHVRLKYWGLESIYAKVTLLR